MSNRLGYALLGGLLSVVAYAAVAFVLLMRAGEAAPVVAGLALICSPIPLVGGMMLGRAFHDRTQVALISPALFGASVPLIAFFVLSLISSYQQAASSAKFHAESEAFQRAAVEKGIPFPEGSRATVPGAAATDLKVPEAVAFYERKGDWKKAEFGSEVWFVKLQAPDTLFVKVVSEYNNTRIYYKAGSAALIQKEVARSFSTAVEKSNWMLARKFLSAELQARGDAWLQKTFAEIRPNSSPFERKFQYPSSSAPIAVNAKITEGPRVFKYSEIGYFFTEDLIPKVRRIELPERY